MDSEGNFSRILSFFENPPSGAPGDPQYDAAFCEALMAAASAQEASIWRRDSLGRLHMAYGTNVAWEEVTDVVLRQGEGISGAVALSRQAIAVSDAWADPQHDRRVDERIGFRTQAMISAPIFWQGILYGTVNILNHTSGKAFPADWKDKLSAVAAMYGAAIAPGSQLDTSGETMTARRKASRLTLLESRTVIVGISGTIREALHLCLKAARTNVPVLIRGETGTGKELAARRIHEASERAAGPFLDVSCAALPETLLESELFGHVKGAFSGAYRDRRGKFVAASGGTLFFDEIGEMSLSCQAKILRVLQEGRVTPIGSERVVECDVRVIAATHRNLWEDVKAGRFRGDLFYRLCGIEILMPPLRERVEDIPLLAMHFLNKVWAERKRKDARNEPLVLSPKTLEMFLRFSWPGNVRQLEQALYAAVALCEGKEIQPDDLPSWLLNAMGTDAAGSPILAPTTGAIAGTLDTGESTKPSREERGRYLQALEATKYRGTGRWNTAAAARLLGIPRKTLTYRLKRMGMSRQN